MLLERLLLQLSLIRLLQSGRVNWLATVRPVAGQCLTVLTSSSNATFVTFTNGLLGRFQYCVVVHLDGKLYIDDHQTAAAPQGMCNCSHFMSIVPFPC